MGVRRWRLLTVAIVLLGGLLPMLDAGFDVATAIRAAFFAALIYSSFLAQDRMWAKQLPGLTPQQLHEARRAVWRGEVVDDPAVAQAVLRLAPMQRAPHGAARRFGFVVFTVLAVAVAALAVSAAAGGHAAAAMAWASTFVVVVGLCLAARPVEDAVDRRASRAEDSARKVLAGR